MARRVFVDTSGWYALIDRRDAGHDTTRKTVEHRIGDGARLVSTDYVVDESCTLAKARAGPEAAFRLLDPLNGTAALDLEWIGGGAVRPGGSGVSEVPGSCILAHGRHQLRRNARIADS